MRLHNLAIALAVVGCFAAFTATTAMADTIDFSSAGGTVVQSGSTLTTTGGAASVLDIIILNGTQKGTSNNIGTIVFTSGAMASGSFSGPATFGPGGSLVVATNGSYSLDASDASAFVGSFSGTQSWTCLSSTCGVTGAKYSFDGSVTGAFSSAFATALGLGPGTPDGLFISGEVQQTSTGYTISSIDLSVAVAEPSALAMLAMGLLAVGLAGGLLRRRRREVSVA